MRHVTVKLEIYAVIFLIFISRGYSEENVSTSFPLTLGKEAIFAITSISSQLGGNHILSNMTVPDPIKLKRNDVNSFDCFASKYHSKKLSYLSDNTKDATTILLALCLLPHLQTINRENFKALLGDIILFLRSANVNCWIDKMCQRTI